MWEQFKSFLNNLCATAIWSFGGPVLIAFGTALFTSLRHRSVDWWGIVALFVLAVLIFWFGRNRPPKNDSAISTREGKDSIGELRKELSHWQAKYDLDITKALTGKADAENKLLLRQRKPDKSVEQAEVLAKLPVHSIRIEVLEWCEGNRMREGCVFANIKIVSSVNAGILHAWLNVKTASGNRYKGSRIEKLNDWAFREIFFDPKYKMENSRDTPLESLAVQIDRLSAGIPEKGWIGFDFEAADIQKVDGTNFFQNIISARFELEDGHGAKHKVCLPSMDSWPSTNNKIVHSRFAHY